MVMENVIQTWLAVTVEDQRVSHGGIGEAVGRCLGVFYVNDGMVGSRYSEWLHHLMNVLVRSFWWYGRVAKIAKSRTMMCQPGALRSGM